MKVRVVGGAYLLVLKQNRICCIAVSERLRPQAKSTWRSCCCRCIYRTESGGKQSIIFGDEAKMIDYVGGLVNAKKGCST